MLFERGWRGTCLRPAQHLGKCPGYNRGEGNPFLLKWYATREREAVLAAAGRTGNRRPPEPEADVMPNAVTTTPPARTPPPDREAQLSTTLDLPNGFTADQFAEMRQRQWADFIKAQDALTKLGLESGPARDRVLNALVSPKEHARSSW